MDNLEVAYWVATLQLIKEGDKEALERLKVVNEIRAKNGQKSIEDELREIAAKADE